MKCDVLNFNKPWKISLEDHYQTPDTLLKGQTILRQ